MENKSLCTAQRVLSFFKLLFNLEIISLYRRNVVYRNNVASNHEISLNPFVREVAIWILHSFRNPSSIFYLLYKVVHQT